MDKCLGTAFLVCAIVLSSPATWARQSVTGLITTWWGDPPPQSFLPGSVRFELTDEKGVRILLNIDDGVLRAAGGIRSLDRQWVTADVEPELLHSETEGRSVYQIQRANRPSLQGSAMESQSAVSGTSPWITLPCKFPDVAGEPKNQAYFNAQYGNNPGELNHFWKTESYNIINIDGSFSSDWLNLPNGRSDYIPVEGGCFSTPANLSKLFTECVATHDATVDFSSIFGINMVFNDDLDGCAWGGGKYTTLDGVRKVWPVTWLPPWGYENNDTFEHENGHGFGLPHSNNWDGDSSPYDNQWDYMSTGDFYPGANDYGRWGTGGMAYHKELLDWITPGEIMEISQGVHTVDLDPLATAITTNPRMVKLPLGSGRYWVIEARAKTGVYEIGLPGTAVLISEVDTNGRDEIVWVYDDADPPAGSNNNEGSMWKVGETFIDADNSISVEILQTIASGGFKIKITRPGEGCTPALLELANNVIVSQESHSACEINAGSNYEVMGPGGDLSLNAHIVRLLSGFKVSSGGTLNIGDLPSSP